MHWVCVYLEGGKLRIPKYRNRKIEIDGIKFDSQKEAARWYALKLLEKKGIISELKRQVRYELIPKSNTERACFYVADFVYIQDGSTVVEDSKGYRTKEYIVKRKLFKWKYPGIKFIES